MAIPKAAVGIVPRSNPMVSASRTQSIPSAARPVDLLAYAYNRGGLLEGRGPPGIPPGPARCRGCKH